MDPEPQHDAESPSDSANSPANLELPDSGAGGRHDGEASTPRSPIPSAEDCLRALAAIPALVALRVLQPAQSNSIRNIYQTILQFQYGDRNERTAQLGNDAVLAFLDGHPEVLNLLAPLLSADQITMVTQHLRK